MFALLIRVERLNAAVGACRISYREKDRSVRSRNLRVKRTGKPLSSSPKAPVHSPLADVGLDSVLELINSLRCSLKGKTSMTAKRDREHRLEDKKRDAKLSSYFQGAARLKD